MGRKALWRNDTFLVVTGAILVSLVAVVDYLVPAPIALSFGHAAVVCLGLTARKAAVPLLLASLGTVACIAGVGLDMAAGGDMVGAFNRGIAIAAIWMVLLLVLRSSRIGHRQGTGDSLNVNRGWWHAVYDQTFQFVAALDLDGMIAEANQTLRDYAGLTTTEIRDMPIWELPIFKHDETARERLRSAIGTAAAGDFVRDEFVVSGLGDRSTVIDFSLKPIRDEDDNIRQIIMEARDITEARMHQEMLVQAQKMEAVGELTAGVAHDFNNLLTVIVGNLELLERRIKDNPGAQERLDRAVTAAFRGQALIQQLLAFSRRQSLNPIVLEVNTLLGGMNQLFEAIGEEIEIEFDLPGGLPPSEIDPILLETALLNLAINARDAMPEGGILRFQTALVSFDKAYSGDVSELPPGEYICLTVSDTGGGIPPEILSQVFDPFFSTKAEGQGTGLGLSMVYGFVKQSGGDVKIYSEVGQGTTVRIYLPVTDKPLPETSSSGEVGYQPQDERAKSVLLVDDNEEVRDVVKGALQDIGCVVETADNGDDAIEMIRAGNRYDLIFTDMVMSGDAGGPEVAQAARAVAPDVPVIFCSGFPRKMLRGEEESVEGSFFLAKPFHQDALIGMVRRAFARAERRAQLTGATPNSARGDTVSGLR